EYSLPWQSGMTGIAYNDKLTDPVLSIDDLLTNPKLKGKITVLNSMGDALTCVMLANGADPTKVTDASFNKAFNQIKKAVDSKQIRQFTGNDYAPLLAKGDLSAAMSWAGALARVLSARRDPAKSHHQPPPVRAPPREGPFEGKKTKTQKGAQHPPPS